eukprot:scaffold30950_cov48-Attheya_sp.AAC.3
MVRERNNMVNSTFSHHDVTTISSVSVNNGGTTLSFLSQIWQQHPRLNPKQVRNSARHARKCHARQLARTGVGGAALRLEPTHQSSQ